MSAYFCNKTIFPDPNDVLSLEVLVGSQPSVTGVYIDGILSQQFQNNLSNLILGNGSEFRLKKIRIHTSVQDNNENTDKIYVHHILRYGNKLVEKEIDLTAEEEGDLFDMYTDIKIY